MLSLTLTQSLLLSQVTGDVCAAFQRPLGVGVRVRVSGGDRGNS